MGVKIMNTYSDSEVTPDVYPDSMVTPDEPGIMSGLKAGFMQQPNPSNAGTLSNAAHFVGENTLPMTGAVIGGLAAAPTALLSAGTGEAVGVGLGAAGGRAIQKGAQNLVNEYDNENLEQVSSQVKDISKTGVVNAIGQKVLGPSINWVSKQLGTIIANVFGGTSGVGNDTISSILLKESREGSPTGAQRIWNKIGKVTEYDVNKARNNLPNDSIVRTALKSDNPVKFIDDMWHDIDDGRNEIYTKINDKFGTDIAPKTDPKTFTPEQSKAVELYFTPIENYFDKKAALALTPIIRSQNGQTVLAELGAATLGHAGFGLGPIGIVPGAAMISPRVGGDIITGVKALSDITPNYVSTLAKSGMSQKLIEESKE